jgi:hypothetical protein
MFLCVRTKRSIKELRIIIKIVILFFTLIAQPVVVEGAALAKGYLLVQDVATYNQTKFGAISTDGEAEKIFSRISGEVNGVEFATLFYDKKDLEVHRRVGGIAKQYQIDLWATTWRLVSHRARAFGLIEPEYQACVMGPDGKITPATYEGRILLDVLNPVATDWLVKEYTEKYLIPFKGMLKGLFFNEDAIPYLNKWANDRRYDYWNNASYSKAVFNQWKQYCLEHKVFYQGRLVDKFPVHRPEMVAQGGGMTAYFTGYNIPEKIYPGERFIDLPRASGVWKHWYEFLGQIFLKNWVGKLAKAANRVNADNPEWLGVIYFNMFNWMLSYESIKNPLINVPVIKRWGVWGRQRGIDLAAIAANPEIKGIICETYPPIAGDLGNFVAEVGRLVKEKNKVFGVMLHRDDRWPLDSVEQKERWQLIEKLQPIILARFPMKSMLPWGPYYRQEAEEAFQKSLVEYRNSGQR